MATLNAGVKQFQDTTYVEHQALFEKLATGQAPDVLFVTCSDSRVVPGMITTALPGDLFVIRNAGNLIPAHGAAAHGGEAATVEYAMSVLKAGHIIICGHSDCGAMGALITPGKVDALPAIKTWLDQAEPTRQVVAASGIDAFEDRHALAIEVNVLQQLANLRTHPSVATALAKGTVKLHGWVYNIGTGAVTAYDGEAGKFVPLATATGGMRSELDGLHTCGGTA